VNGVDPLAEDDDDRLKEIARQYEEKYVSTYSHGREHLTLPSTLYMCWFRHQLHLKNVVFWDVTPCGFCKNQHFGGT
jgi:hypothetical protein